MILLFFIALVVAFVMIGLLKQRTDRLEETVANLRQRLAVIEGARLETAPRKPEHPPVVERPRQAVPPQVGPRVEPDPIRPKADPTTAGRQIRPKVDATLVNTRA